CRRSDSTCRSPMSCTTRLRSFRRRCSFISARERDRPKGRIRRGDRRTRARMGYLRVPPNHDRRGVAAAARVVLVAMKRSFVITALFTCSLGAALVVAEGLTRVFVPQVLASTFEQRYLLDGRESPEPGYFASDPFLPQVLSPGFHHRVADRRAAP